MAAKRGPVFVRSVLPAGNGSEEATAWWRFFFAAILLLAEFHRCGFLPGWGK
jgi:hypothetical protein